MPSSAVTVNVQTPSSPLAGPVSVALLSESVISKLSAVTSVPAGSVTEKLFSAVPAAASMPATLTDATPASEDFAFGSITVRTNLYSGDSALPSLALKTSVYVPAALGVYV